MRRRARRTEAFPLNPCGMNGFRRLRRGDEGRAGAEKGIKDDVATLSQIEQRVLKHRGRLDGRMFGQASAGVGAE